MKKFIQISFIVFALQLIACKKDSEFLDEPPTSILSPEQAFKDAPQALSVLADLYTRQLDFSTVEDWASMADFSESFPSENGRSNIVQRNSWGYGEWGNWDYGYVRQMNLFIERAGEAETLTAGEKSRLISEARFLRANFYFELAKRMGGVPIITKSLLYDFSGDPTYLQEPRSKEAALYDFILKEGDEIKDLLPANLSDKSRASKGAVLAMQVRAALYAGSIAKYGATTPQVSLPGGEVGIPAAAAAGYYTIALNKAKELISGTAGGYGLYKVKPDLSENFANIFIDKSAANIESIFVEDYKLKSGKVHGFTQVNQPRFGAEEEEGGRINPSLNLVQSFEKLDNTFAPLNTAALYTNQLDIFAGRDARLAGTVILPGSTFKNRPVDIWAGYQLANGTIVTSDDRGKEGNLPGVANKVQVVGFDGPVNNKEFTAQTGFYLRKYLDPAPGSGSRGTGSELPFIRYRFAEVLLNAAEAAFELGLTADAAGYLNSVRERAGLLVPLTGAQVTFDRIVHERRAELSFEGHVLFDKKRWRIAHIVWDGNKMNEAELTSNIGTAKKRNTQPFGLWPYRIHNPGSPDHGKWTFKIVLPGQVTGANRFQFGNYYSNINDGILATNPKIVRQPNQ